MRIKAVIRLRIIRRDRIGRVNFLFGILDAGRPPLIEINADVLRCVMDSNF